MTAKTSLVLMAFVSLLMMAFGLVRFGIARWNQLQNGNTAAVPDNSDLGVVWAGIIVFCIASLGWMLLSWLERKEAKKLKGAYIGEKGKKGRWRIYW